jgi:putative Mn2+ efflux pump MntP
LVVGELAQTTSGHHQTGAVRIVLKLLAFVLPLGMDSFAVAAALGAAGLAGFRERLRVSLIFVVFEAGMPLIGLAAGGGIARAVGSVADYLAGAAVIALGIFMLASGGADEEGAAGRLAATRGGAGGEGAAGRLAATRGGAGGEGAAGRLAARRSAAAIALGLSISLDEFAIGFSLGLVRLPVLPVIAAIAVLALVASQAGLAVGGRISERLRERAEQLAAVALIVLGIYLVVQRLFAH